MAFLKTDFGIFQLQAPGNSDTHTYITELHTRTHTHTHTHTARHTRLDNKWPVLNIEVQRCTKAHRGGKSGNQNRMANSVPESFFFSFPSTACWPVPVWTYLWGGGEEGMEGRGVGERILCNSVKNKNPRSSSLYLPQLRCCSLRPCRQLGGRRGFDAGRNCRLLVEWGGGGGAGGDPACFEGERGACRIGMGRALCVW